MFHLKLLLLNIIKISRAKQQNICMKIPTLILDLMLFHILLLQFSIHGICNTCWVLRSFFQGFFVCKFKLSLCRQGYHVCEEWNRKNALLVCFHRYSSNEPNRTEVKLDEKRHCILCNVSFYFSQVLWTLKKLSNPRKYLKL